MSEKMFPLQAPSRDGKVAPHPLQIPWSVAEKAYSVYASRYSRSQSLEGLAARGGFGGCEMDELYPEWRDEVSAIESLKNQLAALTQRAEQAEAWQNRAINSAKQIATVECIDGVWWAKCRHGGLYGPQATEREAWLEVAEMRLTAAEAEAKRLREGIEGLSCCRVVIRDVMNELVDQEASGIRPHTHVDFDEQINGLLRLDRDIALLAQPSDGKEATDE